MDEDVIHTMDAIGSLGRSQKIKIINEFWSLVFGCLLG